MALCGVQTPNCVRATAVDALGLDYRVAVLADATASKSDAVQVGMGRGKIGSEVLGLELTRPLDAARGGEKGVRWGLGRDWVG